MSPYVRLVRFTRRMHDGRVTPRDVLLLMEIANRPGINGVELAAAIGAGKQVFDGVQRLLRMKLIEDRRERRMWAASQRLVILPAGKTFILNLFREPADASDARSEGQGLPGSE